MLCCNRQKPDERSISSISRVNFIARRAIGYFASVLEGATRAIAPDRFSAFDAIALGNAYWLDSTLTPLHDARAVTPAYIHV